MRDCRQTGVVWAVRPAVLIGQVKVLREQDVHLRRERLAACHRHIDRVPWKGAKLDPDVLRTRKHPYRRVHRGRRREIQQLCRRHRRADKRRLNEEADGQAGAVDRWSQFRIELVLRNARSAHRRS